MLRQILIIILLIVANKTTATSYRTASQLALLARNNRRPANIIAYAIQFADCSHIGASCKQTSSCICKTLSGKLNMHERTQVRTIVNKLSPRQRYSRAIEAQLKRQGYRK